jgi:predicted dienelactone hydrolase
MVRLCATLLICLLSSLNTVHAAPAPHPHWSVGYHEMKFLDPLDLQPMRAIAFYSIERKGTFQPTEGYTVEAGEDTKVAIGRFPMLMLSHGNTGTPLALHDLATSLARKGFVVVAVIHPGDNPGSQSSRHLEQSVRAADPDFRSHHCDPGRPHAVAVRQC